MFGMAGQTGLGRSEARETAEKPTFGRDFISLKGKQQWGISSFEPVNHWHPVSPRKNLPVGCGSRRAALESSWGATLGGKIFLRAHSLAVRWSRVGVIRVTASMAYPVLNDLKWLPGLIPHLKIHPTGSTKSLCA
jgi:hypothetical protein